MPAQVNVSVSEFRQWFSEFADVSKYPDAVLQADLEQAQCYVSPTNFGPLKNGCRKLAIYLMLSHLQTLGSMLTSGQTQAGFTSSTTIDKVSVTRTPPPFKGQLSYWLNLTQYGSRLLALISVKTGLGFYFGGEYEKVFR